MKRRSLTQIIALLLVLASTSACDRLPLAPSGEPKATATPLAPSALATPTSPPRTCDNPIPAGQSIVVDNLELMINAVVLPANAVVEIGNPSNLPPEQGEEYILVSLSIICRRSDGDCALPPVTSFYLTGSPDPPRLPVIDIAGVPGLLGPGTLSPGSTIYGGIVFEIPTGQQNLLLAYTGAGGEVQACFLVPHWMRVEREIPTPVPPPTRTPRPPRTPRPTATPPTSPLATPTATPPPLLPPSGDGIEWSLVLSGLGGMLILIGWIWHQLRSRHRNNAQHR